MLLEVFFELRYRFLPNVRWIPNHTVKPARAHDLADGGGHAALCRGGSRTAPTFGWRIALRRRSVFVAAMSPSPVAGGDTGATAGTKFQSKALMRSRSSSANNMPWS